MPEIAMAKSIYDRGLLKPVEVAKLQRVFDQACLARKTDPESSAARELALKLLALHDAGMEDERDLRDAVSFRLVAPKQ
jgi:hypothetical protein